MDTTQKIILQNDIRLLEKEKKKFQADLIRLDDTKREEYKNFITAKNIHSKELTAIRIQIDRLQQGFELLKTAIARAEKDLATYNKNELIQAQQQARDLLLYAQTTEKAAKIHENTINQAENLVKVRELAVEKREELVNEKETETDSQLLNLIKREKELEANLQTSHKTLTTHMELAKLAEKREIAANANAKFMEDYRKSVKADIEQKFSQAKDLQTKAEEIIAKYTSMNDYLATKTKELEVKEIQLNDRQQVLQRAIKEWEQKGVIINGK